ncbi:hypothetical protein AAHA92_04176 [Salvia divinorum]|uniref:Uncharacterized protein n=1 Tax=Salvia divinorum TaxID=28513 RepID=A0ABD1I089_SALDI
MEFPSCFSSIKFQPSTTKRVVINYNSLRDELKNRKSEGFGFEIAIGARVMMAERDDLEQVVMIFQYYFFSFFLEGELGVRKKGKLGGYGRTAASIFPNIEEIQLGSGQTMPRPMPTP